jgi:hypothetical protein
VAGASTVSHAAFPPSRCGRVSDGVSDPSSGTTTGRGGSGEGMLSRFRVLERGIRGGHALALPCARPLRCVRLPGREDPRGARSRRGAARASGRSRRTPAWPAGSGGRRRRAEPALDRAQCEQAQRGAGPRERFRSLDAAASVRACGRPARVLPAGLDGGSRARRGRARARGSRAGPLQHHALRLGRPACPLPLERPRERGHGGQRGPDRRPGSSARPLQRPDLSPARGARSGARSRHGARGPGANGPWPARRRLAPGVSAGDPGDESWSARTRGAPEP